MKYFTQWKYQKDSTVLQEKKNVEAILYVLLW